MVAFKVEIRERARAMADEDYYTILGVARDADEATIQAAFFKLAKRWHPDRLGAEYADMREDATRVFSRMTEAHHVLTDVEQRGDYDGVLKEGGGSAEEQEQVLQVLRAATSYQKAQVLLKKHDLAGAEAQALLALEGDPAQADYMALLAWIQSQKPEAGNEQLGDAITMLNQAVSREPNNERARFFRGQLLKRTGKLEGAMRDFRWIVEHNPKHVDAQRELRLYTMRALDESERKKERSGEAEVRDRRSVRPFLQEVAGRAQGRLRRTVRLRITLCPVSPARRATVTRDVVVVHTPVASPRSSCTMPLSRTSTSVLELDFGHGQSAPPTSASPSSTRGGEPSASCISSRNWA